eukprot:Selendium_serpulae@DN6338_c4_g1_i16.p1
MRAARQIFSATHSQRRGFAGKGGEIPSYITKAKHQWGPEIKDNSFMIENQSYSGFVLWLRGTKPYMEKLGSDTAATVVGVVNPLLASARSTVLKYNPDLQRQIIAFGSFVFFATGINAWFAQKYQKLMDVKQVVSLATASDFEELGFWRSQSEDLEQRAQRYADDHARLGELWDSALFEATTTRRFDALCRSLEVDEQNIEAGVPAPISWRFNMVPYGDGNPDTQTFDTPSHEKPLRSFVLNFTYNNIAYDWGDYINRKDNKMPLMRPARPMFTDVYIPGTK